MRPIRRGVAAAAIGVSVFVMVGVIFGSAAGLEHSGGAGDRLQDNTFNMCVRMLRD